MAGVGGVEGHNCLFLFFSASVLARICTPFICLGNNDVYPPCKGEGVNHFLYSLSTIDNVYRVTRWGVLMHIS